MEKKPYYSLGFSLIELMVVIGISAFLIAAVGLSVYYGQKNNLILEQVAQDLSSEIRLVQSRIIGIQNVGSITPKAAVIKIQKDSNATISYINSSCSYVPSLNQTFEIMPKAKVSSITSGGSSYSTVYLVSITPAGQFYAMSTLPTFSAGANKSCRPSGALISNATLTVALTQDDSRYYYIKIDSNNGAITPTPNP